MANFLPNYNQHPLATAVKNSWLLLVGFKAMQYEVHKRTKPILLSELFQVEKTEHLSEVYAQTIGLGLAVPAELGEGAEFEDLTPGSNKEIRVRTKRKGYRIAQETLEDDIYNISKRPMTSLAKSMAWRVEADCGALVSSSFTTGYCWDPSGATNIPLVGATHTFATGKTALNDPTNPTTWSNVSTAPSAPTVDTVSAMYEQACLAHDEEGFPMETPKLRLFHPTKLAKSLWPIMKSEKKAGEISNTESYTGPRGPANCELIEAKWLTSATAWFMAGPKSESPFMHLWRIMPYTESDTDKNNVMTRVYARCRYGQGILDPHNFWGNAGA